MYHFQISDEQGEYTNAKGYTFLKFEGHSTYDLGHAKAAINRYMKGIDANPGNLVQLREDCNRKDNNKCFYFRKENNDNENTLQDQAKKPEGTKPVDNIYYEPYKIMKSLNNEEIESSLSAYNKNLRTGDEFFVPQVLTDKLLNKLETGNSFGGKRKPRKTKRRKSKKVRKVRKTKSKK